MVARRQTESGRNRLSSLANAAGFLSSATGRRGNGSGQGKTRGSRGTPRSAAMKTAPAACLGPRSRQPGAQEYGHDHIQYLSSLATSQRSHVVPQRMPWAVECCLAPLPLAKLINSDDSTWSIVVTDQLRITDEKKRCVVSMCANEMRTRVTVGECRGHSSRHRAIRHGGIGQMGPRWARRAAPPTVDAVSPFLVARSFGATAVAATRREPGRQGATGRGDPI
jgi:hypothetical protein